MKEEMKRKRKGKRKRQKEKKEMKEKNITLETEKNLSFWAVAPKGPMTYA